MTVVWKLVLSVLKDKTDIDSQVYRSLLAGEESIEYYVGLPVITAIPGACFYAFADLKSAQKYAEGAGSIHTNLAVLRILRCRADVVAGPAYFTMGDMEKFWAEKWWLFEEAWPYVIECAPGTVWCSVIQPLELEAWTDGRVLKAVKKEKKPVFGGYRV